MPKGLKVNITIQGIKETLLESFAKIPARWRKEAGAKNGRL